MKLPTKSCLLDLWPTLLEKGYLDIHLLSIIKLVNCSLSESVVPTGFKKAVVTPLLMVPSLICSVLRLALFYLMLKSFCLACLRALSLVQYSFPKILLPLANSFKIIPA